MDILTQTLHHHQHHYIAAVAAAVAACEHVQKVPSALFGENEIIKFRLMKFRQTIVSFSDKNSHQSHSIVSVHFKGISLKLVPIN